MMLVFDGEIGEGRLNRKLCRLLFIKRVSFCHAGRLAGSGDFGRGVLRKQANAEFLHVTCEPGSRPTHDRLGKVMALAADAPNAIDKYNRLPLDLGRLKADSGSIGYLCAYVPHKLPNVIKRRLSGWFRVKRYRYTVLAICFAQAH